MNKTMRLIALVPYVASMLIGEVVRAVWWCWLRIQHPLPRTFSHIEFQLMQWVWQWPDATSVRERFAAVISEDTEEK